MAAPWWQAPRPRAPRKPKYSLRLSQGQLDLLLTLTSDLVQRYDTERPDSRNDQRIAQLTLRKLQQSAERGKA